jgi:uncharacterized protein YycO
MKLTKRASMAVAGAVVLGSLFATPAHAQDQRTSNQGNTTVKVTTQVPSNLLNQRITLIAKTLGLKVSHPSSKVWQLTGKARQFQSFQKMVGGMGLTFKSK